MLMNHLRSRLLIYSSTLLTVLLIVGLWADWPFGIRGIIWVWARRNVATNPLRVATLLLLIVGWSVFVLWVQRKTGVWQRWQTAVLLAVIVLFTPLLQMAVEAQHLDLPLAGPFMETTMVTTGFFHEGVQISDPNQFIHDHTAQMSSYRGVHLQTQPPGWPILFWATRQFFERVPSLADRMGHQLLRYDCASPELNHYSLPQIASATLLIAVTYISGIGAVLLFLLGKQMFSAEIGRFAALLFPLWPGLLVFKSSVDVLYALVALAALLLTWHAVQGRSNAALAGLCVLLVGMTWVSFGIGATVIWVGLFAALYVGIWERNGSGVWRLITIALALGGTFIAFWGVVYFIWQLSWWKMFQNSIAIHHGMRASTPWWGIYNYYELALFVGLPILIAALWGACQAVLRVWRRQIRRGDGWLLTWLLFLVVLNGLGQVQAETGRIWLFVMPATILAAVVTIDRETKTVQGFPSYLFVLMVAAQAFTVGFLLGGQAAEPRTLTIMRDFERVVAAQSGELTPTAYRFGEHIGLEGIVVEDGADGTAVTLLWRAEGRVSADLTVFVHLFDQAGNFLTQSDAKPAGGQLPTWCWVMGELVADRHLLPRDANGTIRIGLYDLQSGQRLAVSPAVPDNAVALPLR
jgi:hypothetical protein